MVWIYGVVVNRAFWTFLVGWEAIGYDIWMLDIYSVLVSISVDERKKFRFHFFQTYLDVITSILLVLMIRSQCMISDC